MIPFFFFSGLHIQKWKASLQPIVQERLKGLLDCNWKTDTGHTPGIYRIVNLFSEEKSNADNGKSKSVRQQISRNPFHWSFTGKCRIFRGFNVEYLSGQRLYLFSFVHLHFRLCIISFYLSNFSLCRFSVLVIVVRFHFQHFVSFPFQKSGWPVESRRFARYNNFKCGKGYRYLLSFFHIKKTNRSKSLPHFFPSKTIQYEFSFICNSLNSIFIFLHLFFIPCLSSRRNSCFFFRIIHTKQRRFFYEYVRYRQGDWLFDCYNFPRDQ